MFHRKRSRLAAAAILTLVLTVAVASASWAQTPPPTLNPGGGGADPTATPVTNPPGGVQPTATTSGPPGTGNGSPTPTPTTQPPGGGNGGMGGGGDMMAPSWPPSNLIVRHAATPIQISSLGGGLQVYFIGADGMGAVGPALGSISALAEMHPSGAAVELYNGTNSRSGKPVTIHYLPSEMKIRVSTYYADKPPHDFNKAYVFTVDADHSVDHERW